MKTMARSNVHGGNAMGSTSWRQSEVQERRHRALGIKIKPPSMTSTPSQIAVKEQIKVSPEATVRVRGP
ncbi:MAG: hypothetical protein ACYDB8_11765 [Acidiferrobacterales bacterium]